ncbi:prolyl-tRNA synthetase associated domain-containing protein [Chelativorans sp. YIM 93263]|uniref:prolyl-tRNA synthetase associated domain-containing protein n=1 Tax=Chelativorans sp. YIM 93263 TaxID=2906648 RepID=UPI0023790A38|nr:prolyl-tRNA synthetase associated domain-containing protein [Chelativorans sp. YIM 93263]
MPKTPEELLSHLAKLGLEVAHHEHPPLFTVEESRSLRGTIPGGHTKNLFLKDKKKNFYLVTVDEDAEVDLKTIHTIIGASGRVSFGKPDELMESLGVQPGAVTVFGVINDTQRKVTVVLDETLMENDIINGHPLHNEATISIGKADLLSFLQAVGHEPLVLKVSQ